MFAGAGRAARDYSDRLLDSEKRVAGRETFGGQPFQVFRPANRGHDDEKETQSILAARNNVEGPTAGPIDPSFAATLRLALTRARSNR